MKTIEIATGITATLTEDSYEEYMAEIAAMEAERKAAEAEHELWLTLRSMDRNDPLYSDLYKDLYGFRPR